MEQARPVRTRHVWVRSGFGGPPQQGLIVTWRQVPRVASPPAWQALVIQIDNGYGTVRAEWVFDVYLVPVKADPPH
ncbi:MAG TPA: hypothetical protein VFE15_13185 [Marmoricola sp.]|jgi:hypothetical protein|nr:hypothetical protein [Marmoricola sp.]